jgi:hypothetical protein
MFKAMRMQMDAPGFEPGYRVGSFAARSSLFEQGWI